MRHEKAHNFTFVHSHVECVCARFISFVHVLSHERKCTFVTQQFIWSTANEKKKKNSSGFSLTMSFYLKRMFHISRWHVVLFFFSPGDKLFNAMQNLKLFGLETAKIKNTNRTQCAKCQLLPKCKQKICSYFFLSDPISKTIFNFMVSFSLAQPTNLSIEHSEVFHARNLFFFSFSHKIPNANEVIVITMCKKQNKRKMSFIIHEQWHRSLYSRSLSAMYKRRKFTWKLNWNGKVLCKMYRETEKKERDREREMVNEWIIKMIN